MCLYIKECKLDMYAGPYCKNARNALSEKTDKSEGIGHVSVKSKFTDRKKTLFQAV
jgi:hypothetical protein